MIKAALSYAQDMKDTQPDDDGMVRLVYIVLRNQIKRDFERYQNRLKANRENGRKGGAPVGNLNARKRGFDDLVDLCFSSDKTTETRQEKEKEKEKEEDKYKEKEKKENKENNKQQEKENRSQPGFGALCEQIVSLYHSLCPNLSENISFVDPNAVERIQAMPNFLSFEHLFDTVRRSDFLSGRSGKWTGCDLSFTQERYSRARMTTRGQASIQSPRPISGVTRACSMSSGRWVCLLLSLQGAPDRRFALCTLH